MVHGNSNGVAAASNSRMMATLNGCLAGSLHLATWTGVAIALG